MPNPKAEQLLTDFETLSIIAARISVAIDEGNNKISLDDHGETSLSDAASSLALMLDDKTTELEHLLKQS